MTRPPEHFNAIDRLRMFAHNPYGRLMGKAAVVTAACMTMLKMGGDSYAATSLETATYNARHAIARPYDGCDIASVVSVADENGLPKVAVELATHESAEAERYMAHIDERGRLNWSAVRAQARVIPSPPMLHNDATFNWPAEQVVPEDEIISPIVITPGQESKAGDEIAVLTVREVQFKDVPRRIVYRSLGVKSCGSIIATKNAEGALVWKKNDKTWVYVDKVVSAACAISRIDTEEVFCHKDYTNEARGAR